MASLEQCCPPQPGPIHSLSSTLGILRPGSTVEYLFDYGPTSQNGSAALCSYARNASSPHITPCTLGRSKRRTRSRFLLSADRAWRRIEASRELQGHTNVHFRYTRRATSGRKPAFVGPRRGTMRGAGQFGPHASRWSCAKKSDSKTAQNQKIARFSMPNEPFVDGCRNTDFIP